MQSCRPLQFAHQAAPCLVDAVAVFEAGYPAFAEIVPTGKAVVIFMYLALSPVTVSESRHNRMPSCSGGSGFCRAGLSFWMSLAEGMVLLLSMIKLCVSGGVV